MTSYGGLKKQDMHRRKGLKKNQDILYILDQSIRQLETKKRAKLKRSTESE
jgi:hypothetical protein